MKKKIWEDAPFFNQIVWNQTLITHKIINFLLFFRAVKVYALGLYASLLNPFTSLSGPLEPALISGFCSVKRMRVIDSP